MLNSHLSILLQHQGGEVGKAQFPPTLLTRRPTRAAPTVPTARPQTPSQMPMTNTVVARKRNAKPRKRRIGKRKKEMGMYDSCILCLWVNESCFSLCSTGLQNKKNEEIILCMPHFFFFFFFFFLYITCIYTDKNIST